MEDNNQNINKDEGGIVGIIHVLLSHSYALFLFAVIFGVILDQIFPLDFFNKPTYQSIGFIMIVLGTAVVYWAQFTTKPSTTKNDKERDLNFFLRGPYKYTRNPTNFGLTFMSVGLGFLINSPFSVALILAIYIVSRLFFIKKQDHILEERYGEVFSEYKKKVKNWLLFIFYQVLI